MNKFQKKLIKIQKKNNSLVCIGLDTNLTKIPKHLLRKSDPMFEFNKAIIDATYDLVCAYKPNIAFYEAQGIRDLMSLKRTIEYLKNNYPEIIIILDMKRADIGNTTQMYAKAAFEFWEADAITAYAHLGLDSIESFLKYKDRCTFFLIHTSNPDARIFQEAKIGETPLYLYMAKIIKKWNGKNIGIFAGATYPKILAKIRKIFPDSPILTAGVGAQGGDVKKVIKAGRDKNGMGIIINSSRSIIYASSSRNFAQKAKEETEKLKNLINKYRIK